MARPIIVARTMTPCTTEQNRNILEFLRAQVGDEYLLLVIPSHTELHSLGAGQTIPAAHVITKETVYVNVPHKSLWASFVALFPTRKTTEAAHG